MDCEVLISKFPVSSIQLHALFVSMFLNIICFCSTLCIIHLNQWHGTFLLQFPHICLEIFNYVVVHKIWNRRSGVNFNLLDRIVLSTCLWKLYLILHLLLLKWIHGIPPSHSREFQSGYLQLWSSIFSWCSNEAYSYATKNSNCCGAAEAEERVVAYPVLPLRQPQQNSCQMILKFQVHLLYYI